VTRSEVGGARPPREAVWVWSPTRALPPVVPGQPVMGHRNRERAASGRSGGHLLRLLVETRQATAAARRAGWRTRRLPAGVRVLSDEAVRRAEATYV
jgi:hypothetical protein